jgi:hypothetical protein
MTGRGEGDRHGGVDVRAGEVTGRVDHDHDHEAEDGGHAAGAEGAVARRVGDDRPAAGEDERERRDGLGDRAAREARRCHGADGTRCVCELVPLFDVSQPTLSHHLSKLRAAGIVDSHRRGLWAYYHVRPRRSPSCPPG